MAVSRVGLGLHTGAGGPLYTYEYTFEFMAPFVAQPDVSYFLAIHLLDHFPIGSPEFYFSTATGPMLMSSAHTGTQDFSIWYNNAQTQGGGTGHLAFELFDAIPEPSSASIVLLAILSLPPRWMRVGQ